MSISSPEEAPSEPSASSVSAAAGSAHELLACVSCRARKLKCDRQKPICARCAKAGGECVYPEARRKPAFKRRNVRELEERLAQVEGLLNVVSKQRTVPSDGAQTKGSSPSTLGGDTVWTTRRQNSPREGAMSWSPVSTSHMPLSRSNVQRGELIDLGRSESLPPFEMIEDLHTAYFKLQQHFLPLIHPGNYLRSFHSPPHMRPPMSLQYAIWTAAASGHPKYGRYHDALYRRARQYLEADELKGHGEHFITIGHAQAWAILATDEARHLLFTRAAMSSARSVRLAGMMGLNRLDCTLSEEDSPMVPMITPPRSWVELEERRRLFWGGFCIESYTSIGTGWPTLIDVDSVTTQLPVSEEAFTKCAEEKAPTLHEALKGSSSYSNFAGVIIMSHLYSRLMKHSQRPMPGDRPEDPESGPFWIRHRELDNMLSNVFMFLPEKLRLSRNTGDPLAVQTNLVLHGAIICLHNAAREKADTYKLAGLRQASRTRALTAAQEIVNIVKATLDMAAACKTPLMVLALYLAGSVYTTQAMDDPEEFTTDNLELLINCMSGIEHQQFLTHAYLTQLLSDIERSGITISPDIVRKFKCARKHDYRISLVARGSTSRHSKVESALPGRLPLGAPQGSVLDKCSHLPIPGGNLTPVPRTEGEYHGHASKRARTSPNQPASVPESTTWFVGEETQTSFDPAPDLFEYTGPGWAYATKYSNPVITTLPPRTGPSAVNPRPMPAVPANLVPDFTGFTMPGSAAEPSFPQLNLNTGLGSSTNFGEFDTPTSTTITGSDTNMNLDDVADVEMFEEFQEWGISDPQFLYGMLLDLAGSGGEGSGTGASQSQGQSQSQSQSQSQFQSQSQPQGGSGGMDPWSQHR